jgi:hypothetical protein
MPKTYEPIATTTVSGSTASVTFSSIPATYTDLVVVIDGEGTSPSASQDVTFRFNGETAATNYSETYLRGTGSAAQSGRYSESYLPSAGAWLSGRRYNHIINIQNYSNTTTFKTSLVRTNWAGGDVATIVILWRATPAAINQMVININNGNFASGSTFTLYGIKAA